MKAELIELEKKIQRTCDKLDEIILMIGGKNK